ncbi:Inner membrane protein translocase and chaperone YidC, long form [hydrothermal vent metagenome]|uniref:Membrane protein insertase YidC n=1 Tax=hydrothermal vent metagenome TaxID=652676 RepID=A0A3B0ZZS8_9ZZZZ
MEQQRLFLILLLGMVSVLMYFEWQKDYGPQPAATISNQGSLSGQTDSAGLPVPGTQTTKTDDSGMPIPQSSAATNQPDQPAQQQSVNATTSRQGKFITIESDVLRVKIDTQGGGVKLVDLLKYPVSIEEKDKPFRLMDISAQRNFNAQHGFFISKNDPELKSLTPTSNTVYKSSQDTYSLDGDELVVDLDWTNKAGITFTKRFKFTRGSYSIEVSHQIKNQSSQTWTGHSYVRLERVPPESSGGLSMLPTYTGPVFYSPEKKYDKIDFDEIDDSLDANQKGTLDAINMEFAGGWIAMIEHYFVGAFIPPKEDVYRYFTHKPSRSGNRYWIGMMSTSKTVNPGETLTTNLQLYVGPKIQKDLEVLAPGLELSVDYGWLTVISKPLFWLLDLIHGIVGNWGWAIILLTLTIKLVFYKLSETSYKSMARMKKLAPRMKQISERYADDRQRKGQAIMEMYKKEKVNPMGGCLPILVQIPVFIALYYVLLESVELRQASWIFWFHDLSIKDPYFVLPVLMGASMLFQQRLNPPPPDPMQAKMMMMLPFVFTVLFLFFPSGLVLYWVVNNVLSIAQQWYITRIVMDEGKNKKAKS